MKELSCSKYRLRTKQREMCLRESVLRILKEVTSRFVQEVDCTPDQQGSWRAGNIGCTFGSGIRCGQGGTVYWSYFGNPAPVISHPLEEYFWVGIGKVKSIVYFAIRSHLRLYGRLPKRGCAVAYYRNILFIYFCSLWQHAGSCCSRK